MYMDEKKMKILFNYFIHYRNYLTTYKPYNRILN